jgi:hypothetical protein
MAFTGTAVVVMVSDRKARITGLSLVAGATGTIGLSDSVNTPGVTLPDEFKPIPYNNMNDTITLQDSIQISMIPVTAVATAIPIEVVKTGGDTDDFLATLTNNHASTTSPLVEIYVEWH